MSPNFCIHIDKTYCRCLVWDNLTQVSIQFSRLAENTHVHSGGSSRPSKYVSSKKVLVSTFSKNASKG